MESWNFAFSISPIPLGKNRLVSKPMQLLREDIYLNLVEYRTGVVLIRR